MSRLLGIPSWGKKLILENKFLTVFLSAHLLFAVLLGRLFAFAPDEGGYLYTFDNLYGSRDHNPQLGSGWITAPKSFLWVSYLPAKFLNIIGVPDYLSIRLLSILLTAASIVLIRGLYRRSGFARSGKSRIFLFFLIIPSVFLWTSVGLRESFILFELTLILVGTTHLFENRPVKGTVFIIIGSYGMLATKNYLWICLAASAIALSIILLIQLNNRRRIITFLLALILAPCLLFASTTSWYAVEFLLASVFHTDITATGARSGDSIVQVAIPYIPSDSNGSSGSNGSPKPSTPGGSQGFQGSNGSSGSHKPTTIVTFHGDTTLIALHFYLINNPHALFTRVLTSLGIAEKVEKIWVDKVKSGLIKKSKAALPDSSSLSGYILKPGSIHRPLSIIRPTLLFLFGPIPFLDQGGIALNLVSLESPLWWLLYSIVGYQFFRQRRTGYLRDPAVVFALLTIAAFIGFSALVEVNLGTSFRHRSILLVPLIFLYVRIRSKSNSWPLNPALQK